VAIERLFDTTAGTAGLPRDLYARITFPDPPADRPYVYINMVSTVDGKIVVGKPGGSAVGVGGPTDHLLFRRLQQNADAALIGSGTLRASQVIYPASMARFVATRSGDVPLDNRFFTDAPDRAYVVVPTDLAPHATARIEAGAKILPAGTGDVDWHLALRSIRQDLGVKTLLCEGGGETNAQLIREGLADELFLTVSPKLKGGVHLPTIVGGAGFAPGDALPVELMSVYRDGDELYLRYRLAASPRTFGAS
jgi:2,5-diamino-6-(ribosylamino)-4(3H)-pyrimidinone 5'-phosphate reductase